MSFVNVSLPFYDIFEDLDERVLNSVELVTELVTGLIFGAKLFT